MYYVKQGVNLPKDQSYMLYRLGQDVLSRLLFPLGEYEDKESVRSLARAQSLTNADKKDSQEICFVEDDDYARFITEYADYTPKAGNILDINKIEANKMEIIETDMI